MMAGAGRRLSMLESGSMNNDEHNVKSNPNRIRVYDKISQPGKISPLIIIAALEHAINNLPQLTIAGVKQHSDLIQQSKSKLLKKQNEMLQKELDSAKCLLEKQNERTAESMVENVRLKKQVEDWRKMFGELQDTHVKILHEKEEQRKEFESLHSDLQHQLSSVFAAKEFLEEKTNSLQSELSSLAAAKIFLEEKTNSLKSEMERRTMVSEEEKANLNGILGGLEAALVSVKRDVESSRGVEEKKEGQIVDLRHQLVDLRQQLLDNAEEKICFQQKNNSLMGEVSKCREEKGLLEERIRELESSLTCVNKDLESKDVRLRELTERQSSLENGKPKRVRECECENRKGNGVHEKPKENGAIQRRTAAKSAGEVKTQPKLMTERRPWKQVAGKNAANPVMRSKYV